MALQRISDLTAGTPPYSGTVLLEVSVPTGASPPYLSRKAQLSEVLAETGTVTSVAAGTGLTASPSPIVGVGTMSLTVPVSVANGGTAATTAPAALTNLGAVAKAGDTMTGHLTITGGSVILNNNAPYFAKDTTGVPQPLIMMFTDNSVRIATAGHVIYAHGTFVPMLDLLPNTNNGQTCGNSTNAWFEVRSYNFTNNSGMAEKQDIVPAPSALAALHDLGPKTFRWKDGPDTERTHHGFLAEDVRDVLGADFGGYQAGLDEDGVEHPGIAYNELTAVLWKAVQELAAEVEALKGAAQ